MSLSKLRMYADTRHSLWLWWLLAAITTLVSQFTMAWLNDMYSLTQFPVSFMEGQTTFNATLLKSYYAVLLEKQTMAKYVQVQVADYLFMMTVFVSFGLACIAAYRSLPEHHLCKNFAWAMVIIAPQTATLDAIENAISFVMLRDPQGFANWLVYPYSSFAVAKFFLFTFTAVWVLLAIGLAIYEKLTRINKP